MTDRELLRLHIEAVWNLSLPPFAEPLQRFDVTQPTPPWLLYLGTCAAEQIEIWHVAASLDQRVRLLAHARKAGAIWEPAVQMRREVVFHAPPISPQQQAHAQQRARVLTNADGELLDAMLPHAAPLVLKPHLAPYVGVVVHGQLVTLAHSSRKTLAACELGIETLTAARRQGYAAAATILWTALVQQQGLTPIYSAFAENTASLRLAQATGYLRRIEGVYGPVLEDAE
ncbi:MAG: GNAT family N-acetyltransferase [Ktedonobacterales bacterium]|nr:GNAT family N-acetyltransferase [Ktedonobacterales bacterium]